MHYAIFNFTAVLATKPNKNYTFYITITGMQVKLVLAKTPLLKILVKSNCVPEKGVEAGNKLPRKFPRLAESVGANQTRDCASFNNLIFVLKILNFLSLLNWTILHLNSFSFCYLILFGISLRNIFLLLLSTFLQELVCQKENQFSFFDILQLISAQTIQHTEFISA